MDRPDVTVKRNIVGTPSTCHTRPDVNASSPSAPAVACHPGSTK